MEGRVIDPNSVQSQFQSLTRERDALRHEATVADRNRRGEEEAFAKFRSMEADLTEKLRVAHAILGAETKKRQLLRGEEARLKRVMDTDRSAILELSNTLKDLQDEDRARKLVFIREMDSLNDELDSSLRQHEEWGLMKLVTEESVQAIIDSISTANEDEEEKISTGENLKESLELLLEATSKLNAEKQIASSLQKEVDELRQKVLSNPISFEDGAHVSVREYRKPHFHIFVQIHLTHIHYLRALQSL
jgi:chromosome segregation ATPase